jgi:hypothetical protein
MSAPERQPVTEHHAGAQNNAAPAPQSSPAVGPVAIGRAEVRSISVTDIPAAQRKSLPDSGFGVAQSVL